MSDSNPDGTKLLRFGDLQARGLVKQRSSLKHLIDNHGFPPGYLLSPGSRVWDAAEIEQWLDARRARSKAAA